MKRDITFELPTKTITFKDVNLPDASTPLPPTNATLHIMNYEEGYGTTSREFFMLCGVSWKAHESTGAHKYFFRDEIHWYKHVNCAACLERLT